MEDSTLVENLSSFKLSNSEKRRVSVSDDIKNINSMIIPIKEEEDIKCVLTSHNHSLCTCTESQTNKQQKQQTLKSNIPQQADLNKFNADSIKAANTNLHHKVSHDYFDTPDHENQSLQQETRLIKQPRGGSTSGRREVLAQSTSEMVGLAAKEKLSLESTNHNSHLQPQQNSNSPKSLSPANMDVVELVEDRDNSRSPSIHLQKQSHQPLKQQDSDPMLSDDLDEEQLKRYLAYKRLSEGCNRLNTTFTRKNSLHMVDELPPLTEGETMKHMSYHMSQNIESTASSSSSSSLRSGRHQALKDFAFKRGSQDENTSCSSSTSLERSPSRRRSSTVSQCSSVLSEGTRNQLNFDLSPDLAPDSSILEANTVSPTDLDRPASPEPSSLSIEALDFRPISRLSNEEPMLASPDSTLGDSNDEESSEEKLKRITQSYPPIFNTSKTSIAPRDSDNISNSETGQQQKNDDESNNKGPE